MNCHCGNTLSYENCCQPYHLNENVPTAQALMRSRYSAFVLKNADYLYHTTHPSKRTHNSREAYLHSAKTTTWLKLEILYADMNTVEFKAYYLTAGHKVEALHEKSNFKLENGIWYYVDGNFY